MTISRIGLVASLLSVFLATRAFAVPYCTSTTGITIISGSVANGDTGNIVLANNSTNCTSMCSISGGKGGYIDFSDKDLYAQALSHNMLYHGQSVIIMWQTVGSPGKGNVSAGNTTCQIVGLQF